MDEVLLDVNRLTKVFGQGKQVVTAVSQVSFTVRRNEIVGLVGESGSGKSTLGKLIVGLHDKTAGHVHFANKKLPQKYRPIDFRVSSAQIQMIFQDPYGALNPRMTAAEIVAEGLKINRALPTDEVKQRVTEVFAMVGLSTEFLSRYPHEFSGGQRQRLVIARALIVKPQFIVCDEPLSALDVSVQAQVVNLLKSLQTQLDLTLLFIAHDLSMVRYISDRILVMYRGRLVETGPTDRVFNQPKHPYTQALIAANPIADPQQERGRLGTLGVATDAPVGDTHTGNTLIGNTLTKSPAVENAQGCCYADRCPYRMSKCIESSEVFSLTAADGVHQAACLLNEKEDGEGHENCQ